MMCLPDHPFYYAERWFLVTYSTAISYLTMILILAPIMQARHANAVVVVTIVVVVAVLDFQNSRVG